MRRLRRAAALLTAAAALAVLPGCQGFAEVEKLVVVAGAAVDRDGETFTVTAEILELSNGAEDGAAKTFLLSSSGESVSEAAARMARATGTELYWGHASVFAVSRALAERGLAPVLEWLLRDGAAALSARIVVVEEGKAADVFGLASPAETCVSAALERILSNYAAGDRRGSAAVSEVADRVAVEGAAALIPVVTALEQEGTRVLAIDGLAVFAGDRMRGVFDLSHAASLRMLSGGHDGPVLSVEACGAHAALQCGRSRTRLSVTEREGRVLAEVRLSVSLKLTEVRGRPDGTDGAFLRAAEDAAGEEIGRLCRETLSRDTADFRTDVLGLGETLARTRPAVWRSMRERWGEIYAAAEIRLEVRAEMRKSGEAVRSLPGEGE